MQWRNAGLAYASEQLTSEGDRQLFFSTIRIVNDKGRYRQYPEAFND
jgi:hypothetical protein